MRKGYFGCWSRNFADLRNTEPSQRKPVKVTYWRFCEGLIDPVASSGVLFVSLFSPAAVRALMKTLPLSGRARMNSSGFGANAARPFIDGRHTSLIGSWEFILKRTITCLSPR